MSDDFKKSAQKMAAKITAMRADNGKAHTNNAATEVVVNKKKNADAIFRLVVDDVMPVLEDLRVALTEIGLAAEVVNATDSNAGAMTVRGSRDARWGALCNLRCHRLFMIRIPLLELASSGAHD